MLAKVARVLAVGSMVLLTLYGQASSNLAGEGKADSSYWIVESKDAISYRSEQGMEHVLKGHYTPLHPTDEVYCTVDVPAPPPSPPLKPAVQTKGKQQTKQVAKAPPSAPPFCSLNYVTSDATGLLTDRIPANRWVLMSSIPDIPKPHQLVKSARDLLEEEGRKSQRGGLSKGSGCAGTLPVVAPVCRETIDPTDFTLEWADSPAGGGYATLFIETIDELHSTTIRIDRIPLDAHRYEGPRLRKFFEDVQKDATPTNVLLRLSQSEDSEAKIIVTVPSRVDQKGLHDAINMSEGQPDLLRNISAISVYVDFGAWSKAAQQARQLLKMGPDEELVMTYALIGFCQSGYTHETAELRTRLSSVGVTDVCPEGQK